ncbi:hypothetical protein KAR91_52315 [Candidatus Pacearchaeota archaeon]|nr:hypothetical protein [Candidatus Pacearchaeota archaeon]
MIVSKVMTWSDMQETEHVDDSQALQDLTVCELLTVFGLVDEYIDAQPCKLHIEICTEDVKISIE